MANLTVRNITDDAKHRFRQIAAAHGRSMEEHLRQLIIHAGAGAEAAQPTGFADVQTPFRHERSGENIVRELIRIADRAGDDAFDTGKYAEIRFMTAKDAMAELRRLANGTGFAPPPRLSTELEAPQF